MHAISMYEAPALPDGFDSLPYANPGAATGGTITYGVIGTFDSLNPFVLASMRTTARGMWDPEYGKLVFEPLMTRSADETYTLYGLLAQSARMPEDRKWIEFNLNPAAKWSDGEPVTPDDVIFTYELLTGHGRPPYSSRMKAISKITKTGQHSVRFDFNENSNREMPLIVAAYMPVLPRHATRSDTFENSTLTPMVGSGPYLVEKVEQGTRIAYRKRDDYWGKDVPVNRGMLNFDRIVVDYYRSSQARFEAFKKGLFDVYPEGDPAAWQRAYDFPAVTDGRVKKAVFKSDTPSNMLGFVFNTRRPLFANQKLRRALSMLFDFEWANRSLFFDAYKRTGSYWQGSKLSALGRPASEAERRLLAPFPDAVEPDVMDGTYEPTRTDGSGRDRKVLRAALKRLREAGYASKDGRLVDASGTPLKFEIMTKNEDEEKLAIAFKRTLDLVGIETTLRAVDDAQFQRRSQDFDYDMMIATYSASLAPGIEQSVRWGSASRDIPGSFNYPGAASPAIDAMIAALEAARDGEAFVTAVRALDRVLISGFYLVPLFHLDGQRVAYWDRVAHPEKTPMFGVQYPAWWARDAASPTAN